MRASELDAIAENPEIRAIVYSETRFVAFLGDSPLPTCLVVRDSRGEPWLVGFRGGWHKRRLRDAKRSA
jgi:hypothetical protein